MEKTGEESAQENREAEREQVTRKRLMLCSLETDQGQ